MPVAEICFGSKDFALKAKERSQILRYESNLSEEGNPSMLQASSTTGLCAAMSINHSARPRMLS